MYNCIIRILNLWNLSQNKAFECQVTPVPYSILIPVIFYFYITKQYKCCLLDLLALCMHAQSSIQLRNDLVQSDLHEVGCIGTFLDETLFPIIKHKIDFCSNL